MIRTYKCKLNKRQIARDVGLSYSVTCKIIDRFNTGSMAALAPLKRWRRAGGNRVLTAQQEAAIRRTICNKCPDQLKMDFALWSRPAVMQPIEREYGVTLHLRQVGKYLARWGFTPQKSIQRTCKQSPEVVRTQLDDTYPAIAERATSEGAEIHWSDQTARVTTDVRGRSCALNGKTSVAMTVGGARQTAHAGQRDQPGQHALDDHRGNFNHEKLIEFFEGKRPARTP